MAYLGDHLRDLRNERQLSLRDVQRLAGENDFGVELSSGYLSLLERNEVKEPSPRILYALASIYEVDYIDLMRKAKYIPSDIQMEGSRPEAVAFRGASRLTKDQKYRIQRMIDFELSETRRTTTRMEGQDPNG